MSLASFTKLRGLAIPILSLLILGCGVIARADNWPAWRGPAANSICSEPNPPMKWSEADNVAWKAPVKGKGSSTPIVWDNRIFLTSQTEDEQEWVIGLDRADGKVLWEKFAGKGMTKTRAGANMASPSPVTDGKIVVASFGTGELGAWDFDGKEIWKINLQEVFGKFTVWWGYAISPVIHGDMVFVAAVNEGPSYAAALDKMTGKTLWKTDRKTEATSEPCDAYATPMVYEAAGRKELFVTGANWATAYDPKDGKLLWKASIGGDRTILSPVFYDGIVYDTAGKRGPIFALKPGGSGDVTATNILWKHEKSTPDVPSPVGHGAHLFFVNDNGIAFCLNRADGKVLWTERLGGDFKASPVVAAGNIYFTNQNGETTIVKAVDKYEVIGVNKLGGDGAMSSLAFSDGQIFQRALGHLYCIGKREKSN